nr:DNA-processing protein DprA [Actinomycetota bacterium]
LFGSGSAAPAPRRRSWAEVAQRVEPLEWWGRHAAGGTRVTWPGRPDFPVALAGDPHLPGALFWRGRMDALDRPCVAIVGTRNATPDGRSTAFHLGRDLAAAGVCVVSGLALGIDGAAHAGALAALGTGASGATVGIAASGPDVPYPRRHTRLWWEVAEQGAILSENLPGRPAQAWRFPTRNRIIAGLVSLVVVVESHRCGGSLITAEAAIERGVEVRVVPGPVHSPASEGSNQLLYDGPGPVRDARDVLDALGLFRPDPVPPPAPGCRPPLVRRRQSGAAPAGPAPGGPPGSGELDRVLEAVGWRPTATGQVMERTGLDAATVARRLDQLTEAGLIGHHAGWWSRRS